MKSTDQVSCPLNVHHFPFDTQTCTTTYVSEFYGNLKGDVNITMDGGGSANYAESNK